MTPEPDKAYELVYEYYSFPTDLEMTTDTPTIPERFLHCSLWCNAMVIYLEVTHKMHMVMKQKFDEGIKYMRSQLINRTPYVRSIIWSLVVQVE